MSLCKLNVAKRITLAILGTFFFSTTVLFVVQQWLHARGMRDILSDVRQSTLEIKRQSVRDLLREVKFATEGSLQRGESVQFMRFANQQKELDEIRAFSFIDANHEVQLSSDAARVGQKLDATIWGQVEASSSFVEVESDDMLALYQPLRVDADMQRLRPQEKIGAMYGILHLEFSKEKINQMVADARDASCANANRVLMIVLVRDRRNCRSRRVSILATGQADRRTTPEHRRIRQDRRRWKPDRADSLAAARRTGRSRRRAE